MVNTDKLYSECRAAGLPINTISIHRAGEFTPEEANYYVVPNEYWIEWTSPLTGPQTTALNAVLAAHDPVDYPAIREAGAEAQAASIPNWASWTEAQVLTWLTDNIGTPLVAGRAAVPSPITSFAQVRAIIIGLLDIMDKQYTLEVAQSRMLVALRNKTFPKLEGS